MADKSQIWNPFHTDNTSIYGLRGAPVSTVHTYVNSPAHPLGAPHYYVKIDASAAAQSYLTPLHLQNLHTTAPAGYRSGLKFSMFFRADGVPNADNKILPWVITGIPDRDPLYLFYDSDGYLRLWLGGVLRATSSVTLPTGEDIMLVLWIICRDAAGNRINDQYVCQLVEDPLTVWLTTTTLFNWQDSQQQQISSTGLVTVMWKAAGDIGTNDFYGGSFYIGWEDADSPSGVVRSALLTPSAGTPKYNEWTGVGDTVNKYANVDELPPNDDTDYNTALQTTQYRQSHCLPDSVVGAGNTVLCVSQYCWCRSVDYTKTEYVKLLQTDGTNVVETASVTFDDPGYKQWGGDAYGPYIWQTAPDAGAWTPTDIDNLQLGYREGNGGAAIRVSATHGIVAHYNPDNAIPAPPTPAAVGGRRRTAVIG